MKKLLNEVHYQMEMGLKPKPLDVTLRTTSETRVIITRWVNIEGEEFELDDLYNTLSELEGCAYDTIISNKKMADHFIKIEVLKSAGSRRNMIGARLGPCFKDLYNQVSQMMDYEEEDDETLESPFEVIKRNIRKENDNN